MAKVLILGGTRNLGHVTALALLRAGHSVSVLNRGLTSDDLPPDVERLRGSRGDLHSLRRAVGERDWDVVVDTTSYTAADAQEVVELLAGKCGRMIFISTGQVYLVRTSARAPFTENDFDGDLVDAPLSSADYDQWLYGVDKRNAENVYERAARADFPVVSLRLPMIASERDHYGRIQGYAARINDGGPLLIPDDESLPIRHVYVEDVARVISSLCTDTRAGSSAYNISYPESISLAAFMEILGATMNRRVTTVPVTREILESRGLLPACSPYSTRWMSELDSSRSVLSLTPGYTSPSEYVPAVLADYEARWMSSGFEPPGYNRRSEEIEIAKNLAENR